MKVLSISAVGRGETTHRVEWQNVCTVWLCKETNEGKIKINLFALHVLLLVLVTKRKRREAKKEKKMWKKH